MTATADLHVHTTFSDGGLSPTQVLEEAEKAGLVAVAITDHDSMGGVKEAAEAGQRLGVQVIAGVELSANEPGEELHLLGLFLESNSRRLQSSLEVLRRRRRERIFEIVKKLANLGVRIEPEAVFGLASAHSVGRPHVAEALVQAGVVSGREEAFGRFLGDWGPAYVPRRTFSLAETCELIRQARGVALWAHPGEPVEEARLKQLIDRGVEGIEVYSPMHTEQTCAAWLGLARKYGLLVSGGSDFHGNRFGPHPLGAAGLSAEEFGELCQQAESHRA